MKGSPKRFRVVPQEQGSTLRNLLVRRVGGLDRDRAAALIRAGGVYVNRLRVRLPQVLVAAGERVTVYLEALDAEPLAPERVVFVHRDDDFVILDKPAGVPVTPTRETAVGCLSEALIHKLESEGVSRPYVGVVHRLDRGASGLILFTVRGVANKSLHKQFRDHEIRRGYRIRARSESGQASAAAFSCDAPLIKLREGGVEIGGASDSRAKSAVTHFRHLAELPPLAGPEAGGPEHLLDVELETGRTHQIRAHAAHLGFPVVGDRRYGRGAVPSAAPSAAPSHLCLHAWTLDFAHPRTGEAQHFESVLPEWARVPASER
ncbi:RluA family pseudouridine synthase [Enhygromyxa salina]|uniref:RluA family pseudouridine synthase n=1 Tax=Enhygromyxa salina TaxID=215803 RepID=UPI0015E618BF|nr:RluA family pseudouridine synthase [Enhygromyxa salina]